MTILNEIKNLIEVDIEETIFDNQLLFYANSGISYLIIKYLYIISIQQFDQDLISSSATNDFLESEKLDILMHLKIRYQNYEKQ